MCSAVFKYGTLTLCGVFFQRLPLTSKHTPGQSYNPNEHARWFGLFRFRSPLLTESLLVFFSSAYLDVSVRQVRDCGLHAFSVKGCPIRTSTDLWSFAPPRCFSQLTTSFVASGNQGIPRAPFLRFHILSPINPNKGLRISFLRTCFSLRKSESLILSE